MHKISEVKKMSKKTKKQQKTSIVGKSTKANGTDEYYLTKAPQKTVSGKVIIIALAALMALGSIGSLIIAFVQLAK